MDYRLLSGVGFGGEGAAVFFGLFPEALEVVVAEVEAFGFLGVERELGVVGDDDGVGGGVGRYVLRPK